MTLRYPSTHRGDVVDILHGHRIADPYRWLEDPDSPETKAWVSEQVATTEAYLATLPDREWFRATAREFVLQDFDGMPTFAHGHYVQTRYLADKPQPVQYIASSWQDLADGGGRVFVDPNTWSPDGTSSLGQLSFSPDGTLAAIGRCDAGSDWTTITVIDVATGEVRDQGITTKFSRPVFLPDNASFLYVAYDAPSDVDGTTTAALPVGHLHRHVVGTDPAIDERWWTNPGDPMILPDAYVNHDSTRLMLVQHHGSGNEFKLWVYPLELRDGSSVVGQPRKLIDEFEEMVWPLRADGDRLIASSNNDAPNSRIIAFEPDGTRTEIIPEGQWPIEYARAVGEHLIVGRLVDVVPRFERYALDGRFIDTLDIPVGTVVGIDGEPGRDEFFVGGSTVTERFVSYVGNAATGEVTRLGSLEGVGLEITVQRDRATSKDGTAVPYFLLSPAGDTCDEPAPTLIYGYGGFMIPVTPSFSAGFATWLAAGGRVVIANLRGGGEFGQQWYDAGRAENKQNVFDDACAVAEHLIATGVSSAAQLTLHGRSNGGLLAGACMTQRPDLFGAVLPMVGVLDMLRYHLFTGGRFWMGDYGDPDVAEDFETALAYSPVHNIREGVSYPPTLVATGDHDDRVVPLHSHKFIATLQAAQAGDAPVLTRIEVATGHGAGKPRTMLADEWADILAFAAHHTGLRPRR